MSRASLVVIGQGVNTLGTYFTNKFNVKEKRGLVKTYKMLYIFCANVAQIIKFVKPFCLQNPYHSFINIILRRSISIFSFCEKKKNRMPILIL